MGAVEVPLNNANVLASALVNNLGAQDHLNRASGLEGFKAFQTKPSSEYSIFEENSDVMCVKTTDAQNNPTYRYFAFHEITKDEALQQISPFVMKGELSAIKEDMISVIRSEMNRMKEEILDAQQLVRPKQSDTNSTTTGQPTDLYDYGARSNSGS